MKKIIKSLIKVSLIFIGLFAIMIGVIVADQKIAEYRANSFCEAASKKRTVDEIKQLISQSKGTDSLSFTNEAIVVLFPQMFPEYYACVIFLDENQKPISSLVNHKD